MQCPDKKIFEHYGLEVINLSPYKDGFIVYSKQQRSFVKKKKN